LLAARRADYEIRIELVGAQIDNGILTTLAFECEIISILTGRQRTIAAFQPVALHDSANGRTGN
jgi:hypothetical protein